MIEGSLSGIITSMQSLSIDNCDYKKIDDNAGDVIAVYTAILNNEEQNQIVEDKILCIKHLLDAAKKSQKPISESAQEIVQQVARCIKVLKGHDLYESLWKSQEIRVHEGVLEFSPVLESMLHTDFLSNLLKVPEEFKEKVITCRLGEGLEEFQNQISTMLIDACPNFIGVERELFPRKTHNSEPSLIRAYCTIPERKKEEVVSALLQFSQNYRNHIIQSAIQVSNSIDSLDNIGLIIQILGPMRIQERENAVERLCSLFDESSPLDEIAAFLHGIESVPEQDRGSAIAYAMKK